jgi:uncharacterized protein YecA (UPF0149 family)
MGDIYSAGIMAGANLLSGLMAQRAAAAKSKREAAMQAAQAQATNFNQSQQTLNNGQTRAMSDLLAAFKGATS